MAPKQARQERQLERQRGAGIRQVKNLDIGLILPGRENAPLQPRKSGRSSKTPAREALLPQRSSRRTPAPELPRQTSSRRTPAQSVPPQKSSRRTPASGNIPPQRSVGRPPISDSRKRARSNSESAAQEDNDSLRPTNSKRAKLTERPDAIAEETTHPIAASIIEHKPANHSVAAASGMKKRKKRKSIGQQSSKRVKAQVSPQGNVDKSSKGRGRPKAAEPTVDSDDSIGDQLGAVDAEFEPEVSARTGPIVLQSVEPTVGTGSTPRKPNRKNRVSIGQQSRKKARSAMVTVKEEPGNEEEGLLMADSVQENGIDVEQESQQEEVEIEDIRPTKNHSMKRNETKMKRKKRKSIGQQRPRRISGNALAPGEPSAKSTMSSYGHPTLESNSRPTPTLVASAHASLQNPNDQSEDLEANLDQPQPKSKSRHPAKSLKTIKISATPRLPKPLLQSKVAKDPRPTATKRQSANTIPITVYRAPTPESDSLDSDNEEDLTNIPPTSKSFNAVDVLAQITLERLTKLADKLSAQPTATRTQHKALELYTQQLEQRLRQLSRALDTNAAMKVKAKALGKQEREVRRELKEVVAEKKRVRERAEKLEKERRRGELEGLMGRIQEAVRKGWAMEKEIAKDGGGNVTAGRNEVGGMEDNV